MRKEKLIFGHVTFKWGDTLADIESQISEQDIISRSDDSLYTNKALTIKLTDIWSIKTTLCRFEAVDYDRLIDSVTMNIPANIQKNSSGESFTLAPIISLLEAQLGPRSHYSTYDCDDSSSVVEYCEWVFDNCKISVGRYGDVREEGHEKNIGYLSIGLTDVALLDKLYSQPIRDLESKMANQVNTSSLTRFQTNHEQNMPWPREIDLFSNYSADVIVRAFNGIHKKTRFQTPLAVQSRMTVSEICTWLSEAGDYYLSNYWQTVKLDNAINAKWTNLLPTKFGGVCYISIGDLLITDDHSRPETQAFITHIERILKNKITCHQDCSG